MPKIGILGGSGLYDIEGLTNRAWQKVETPWGDPSDELLTGTLDGIDCVFLPRHGRGHKLSPSHLNYRANIDALKRLGVTHVISLSAVGSLQAGLPPGHFVIVDQFIDRSFARAKSFFGEGCVAHVSMAHPVCGQMGDILQRAAETLGLPVARGGTYLVMEGPQFSTRAESELYRAWGCSVIGMTNMPEAKLAREAELHYATVAMVTDYDCWHETHDHVTVEAVVAVMTANAAHARALVRTAVPLLGKQANACPQGCEHALDSAIITAPSARDPALLAKLDAVAGRLLGEKRVSSAPAQAAPRADDRTLPDKGKLASLAAYSGDPWHPGNPYFSVAEKDGRWLWSNLVWPFIEDSDFSEVIDLAAGHGRNSVFLLEHAGHLTINDIQAGNVDICRKRFAASEQVAYVVGNGFDFSPLEAASLTLIYCFDAMVHFDSDVVRSYLRDARRVLKPGGRGFFHHSNYTGGHDWRRNPNARNFMSKELFEHYALKEGLTIVRQKKINWGKVVDSDCLSLVENPA